MKKLIASTLALTALSSVAGTVGTLEPKKHAYIQLEAGYVRQNFQNDFIPADDFSNDTIGAALRLGYLMPFANAWSFGLELGSLYLGDTSYDRIGSLPVNLSIKQKGLDLLAIAKKDLTDRVNVFGKAGIAYIQQEYDFSNNNNSVVVTYNSKSRVLPEIAAGLGYHLTDNLELTGTVNHIFGKNMNADSYANDIASSTAALVGLRYNFG